MGLTSGCVSWFLLLARGTQCTARPRAGYWTEGPGWQRCPHQYLEQPVETWVSFDTGPIQTILFLLGLKLRWGNEALIPFDEAKGKFSV